MAKCEICGKDVAFGIKVSHSHRRSNRTWKPNIKEKPYGFFFYYYSEIKTSNARHWMFFSYLNFFFISK